MEETIWYEDDYFQFTEARRIDMDSMVVTLPEKCPVVWQFAMEKPIGVAREIREVDGDIVAEIELFEVFARQWDDLREYTRFTGHYVNVLYTDAETKDRVKSCSLKLVSLTLKSQVPGFPKEEK